MKASEYLRKEWPTLLLLLVPIVALPFFWNRVPEEVPIHWGLDGEPDRFAAKNVGLLLLPGINFAVYLTFLLIPLIDPKGKVRFFKKPFPALRFFFALLVSFFFFVTVSGMTRSSGFFDTNRLVPLGVIMMFFVLGNYLSALQPNYFIGIRTPWTLEDPDIWRKTHRLAGWIWVGFSSVALVLWATLPLPLFNKFFLAIVLVAMVLTPVVYSFVLYARKKNPADADR
jgi:uncharacterized membrane protein